MNKVNRNLILFFAGLFTSKLGTQIYGFAISLYVLQKTSSSSLFAISLLVTQLPQVLLGPFAGVLADHMNKKVLVVLMDFVSGFIMLGLLAYASIFSLSLGVIWTASFLLAVANTLFSTSFGSAIPEIVPEEELVRINSYRSVIDAGSMILGPIVGGMIYALVDMKTFILLNGISFILSGVSEVFIDFKLNPRTSMEKKEKLSFRKNMASTIDYIKKDTFITKLIVYVLFINFFSSAFSVMFPYALVNVMKMKELTIGLAEGSFAVGMLVISIYLSTKKDFASPIKNMAIGITGVGLGFILMAYAVYVSFQFKTLASFLVILIGFGIGATIVGVNIPFSVTFQKRVDPNYLGRLSGFLGSVSMAVSPLSIILTGLLLELVPVIPTMIVSGIMLMFIAIKLGLDKKAQGALVDA